MILCYKIVDKEKENKTRTLFKGYHGSRTVPVNEWLPAEKKLVNDGGKEYISGWHVFLDIDTVKRYFARFKNRANREIIIVMAKGLSPKPTNSDIYLADHLLIPEYYKERIS